MGITKWHVYWAGGGEYALEICLMVGGTACSVIPTPQSQPSSLLRSQEKDQSSRNPVDFYDFLFMGVHSPCSFSNLTKQGLSSYFLPGSVDLPTESPCWPPMTQPILCPQTDLDISARQRLRRSGCPLQPAGLLVLQAPTGLIWNPP